MSTLDADDLAAVRQMLREELRGGLRSLPNLSARTENAPSLVVDLLQDRSEIEASELCSVIAPHLGQRAGEMAVANLLRRLGWTKARVMRQGVRVWMWHRPLAASEPEASTVSTQPVDMPPATQPTGAVPPEPERDEEDDSVSPPRPRGPRGKALPTMDEFFASLRVQGRKP